MNAILIAKNTRTIIYSHNSIKDFTFYISYIHILILALRILYPHMRIHTRTHILNNIRLYYY